VGAKFFVTRACIEKTGLGVYPTPSKNGYGASFPEVKRRGMALTTHPDLVPMLKKD